MNKLLWITDAHLEHLTGELQDTWLEKINEAQPDMLLLGGDTADSRSIGRLLGRMQQEFSGKIALVAGNHDHYFTSIAELRSSLAHHHRQGIIVFEPGCQTEPIELTNGVYLCGSGGWGDASAGCADASAMALNDERLIDDLRTRDLNRKLRTLGQESALHLQHQLDSLPANATSVIILTHVPPWPEACWHEGRRSDDYALPRFCWQAGGLVISQAAERLPDTQFTVLCGHTHSAGLWSKDKITCHTGGSTYGRIHHSGMVVLSDQQTLKISVRAHR